MTELDLVQFEMEIIHEAGEAFEKCSSCFFGIGKSFSYPSLPQSNLAIERSTIFL